MTDKERAKIDKIHDECMDLFRRLHLPETDPKRVTPAEFGIRMKKILGENEVEVTVVHKKPESVQKAEEILGGKGKVGGIERGCKND